MSDYCIENDIPRQQEQEAIRQAKIYKEKDEAIQQAYQLGIDKGRKQVARECYSLVKSFALPGIEHVLAGIKNKFGLEG